MADFLTPKQRAEKSAQAMWNTDRASQWLGMKIVEVQEGMAILSLQVQNHHTNGHNICHGGVIFSLADSAFAFACNSRNRRAVAQYNTITYIAPAKQADILTATAHEVSLRGKNGIYDVRVINQDGLTIAEFRGGSRMISGTLFEE